MKHTGPSRKVKRGLIDAIIFSESYLIYKLILLENILYDYSVI